MNRRDRILSDFEGSGYARPFDIGACAATGIPGELNQAFVDRTMIQPRQRDLINAVRR